MMSSEQPRKIYRYQKFNAMTVESLCRDQLHFSDPGAFNDPLDCQPIVETDSDRDTLHRVLTELISRRVESEALASLESANLKGTKAAAHAKKLGEQAAKNELENIIYNATNPNYEVSKEKAEGWLLNTTIQDELLKQYDLGVCCFSSVVKNPLLWSHYGDHHRGVCIGYDLNRNPKPKLHKVKYGGPRTILTSLIAKFLLYDDPKSKEFLDCNVVLRKASPWRYECEWRLLSHRGIQDSPLALKDVTFGLRCHPSVMYAIIKALESREEKIKFYRMVEVRGSFKIKHPAASSGVLTTLFNLLVFNQLSPQGAGN